MPLTHNPELLPLNLQLRLISAHMNIFGKEYVTYTLYAL